MPEFPRHQLLSAQANTARARASNRLSRAKAQVVRRFGFWLAIFWISVAFASYLVLFMIAATKGGNA